MGTSTSATAPATAPATTKSSCYTIDDQHQQNTICYSYEIPRDFHFQTIFPCPHNDPKNIMIQSEMLKSLLTCVFKHIRQWVYDMVITELSLVDNEHYYT